LFPLVVGLTIYVRSTWARALLLLLAAANLFIILNTLSRGGFMALGAAIVLMTLRVSRDRRLVALLVALGLVTYLLLPAALFERFEKVESLRGNNRYVLTMIGVRMSLDNPFLGVGFANFERYFAKYDVAHRGGSTAPHNLYTSIASQTGIPSLLVYLGIVVVSWRRLTRLMGRFRAANDRFLWLLAVALQASLLNLLVFGLTHHVEHQILFFVVVAGVVVLDRLSSVPGESQSMVEEPPAMNEATGMAGRPA
jgi:O-antigen ligase